MAQVQVGGSGSSSGVGQVFSRQQLAVETKATWSDGWSRKPYLEPVAAAAAVAPGIGIATFRYHYGRIKREDKSSFSTNGPLNLEGHFVRIVRLSGGGSGVLWTGVLDVEQLNVDGGSLASGVQTLQAYELGHVLDRAALYGGFAVDYAAEGSGSTQRLQKMPVFNERYRRGVSELGNRSELGFADINGFYAFSADNNLWSNKDIAEHLIELYTQDNPSGVTVELGGQLDVLDTFKSVHALEGLTLWQALNRLIPRGRGMGFALVPSDDKVTVEVFTSIDREIVVKEKKISVNPKAVDVDLGTSVAIESAMIVRSSSTRFDEIEVRGEPMLACFTVSYFDETLEQGWPAALEEEYADAAAEAEGYGSGSLSTEAAKAALNDAYRMTDRFETCYVKHRIPRSWNTQAGDGEGGDKTPAIPDCSKGGVVALDTGAPFYAIDKQFEDFLPLQEGFDYSVDPPANVGQEQNAEPTLRRAFCIVQELSTSRWHLVESRDEGVMEEASADFWLYPRELAFGVQGSPRHLYAHGFFDPDEAEPSDAAPVLTYPYLAATVALRTDNVVRIAGRRQGAPETGGRKMVIEVPGAEVWTIAQGTIVGLDANLAPVRYAGSDGILRDDRGRLEEILAGALAWYGRERASVTLTVKRLEVMVPLGTLLRAAVAGGVAREANTVVTGISWDFQAPEGKTTVHTDWSEYDFREYA